MVLYVQPELRKYTGRVIYKFICPEGKVYVGYASTSYKRIRAHRPEAFSKDENGNWSSSSRWKKAIRRIGWENLCVEIIEFLWDTSVHMKHAERKWIKKLNANNPEFGYNSNPGGGGCSVGRKHTPEEIEKVSKPVISCEIIEDMGEKQKVIMLKHASIKIGAEAMSTSTRKIHPCNISMCCNERDRKGSGGLVWWFASEEELEREFDGTPQIVDRVGDVPQLQDAAVISVLPLEDGNAIERWHKDNNDAARELKTETGKKFRGSAISRCCNKIYNYHHGIYFRKVTTEQREDFDKNGKRIVPFKSEIYKVTNPRKRKRK